MEKQIIFKKVLGESCQVHHVLDELSMKDWVKNNTLERHNFDQYVYDDKTCKYIPVSLLNKPTTTTSITTFDYGRDSDDDIYAPVLRTEVTVEKPDEAHMSRYDLYSENPLPKTDVLYDGEFHKTKYEDKAEYNYSAEEIYLENGVLHIIKTLITDIKAHDSNDFVYKFVEYRLELDLVNGKLVDTTQFGHTKKLNVDTTAIDGMKSLFSFMEAETKFALNQFLIKSFYLPFPYQSSILPPERVIFSFLAKHHKVKATDHYFNYFSAYKLDIEDLSDTNFHLTNKLMKLYGIKGSMCSKIINTSPTASLNKLKYFYDLLGIDYLNKVPYSKLYQMVTEATLLHAKLFNTEGGINFYDVEISLSNSSKNKIINLFEELDFSLIYDHVEMASKLINTYNTPVKFEFRNRVEFDKEHRLFSKIISRLSSNEVVSVDYPEKAYEILEEPILVDDENYIVRLLDSKEEYEEEGQYNSHCVGGYIKRNCHILSIRYKMERCTIEYNYSGTKIQNRMKSNRAPNDNFNLAINELTARVQDVITRNILKPKTFIMKEINKEEILKELTLEC